MLKMKGVTGMRKKTEPLNVRRVKKYMRGLPVDEKGNTIVDEQDLKNLSDAFFGHNREKSTNILDELLKDR